LLCHFDTPVVQQGDSQPAGEFALDAFVSSSPLVAGLKETQESPSVFPTVDKLGNIFRVKFEKVEKDEDQFLADSEVRRAIRYIAIEAMYRGPYELDDDEEKFFYVCNDAIPLDKDCLQGCFGATKRMDGGRVCAPCQRKKQLKARRASRMQKSGVDRTAASSRVNFNSLSPETKNERLVNVARSRKNSLAACRRLRIQLDENLTIDREKDRNLFAVLKEAFSSPDTRKEILNELVRIAVEEQAGAALSTVGRCCTFEGRT
jgi:hypothetical protein